MGLVGMHDPKLAKQALRRVQHTYEQCCILFAEGDRDGHCAAAEEHRAWTYVYERAAFGRTLH